MKRITWYIRAVIGLLFWIVAVLTVKVILGMTQGALEGWRESVDIMKQAWKNKG